MELKITLQDQLHFYNLTKYPDLPTLSLKKQTTPTPECGVAPVIPRRKVADNKCRVPGALWREILRNQCGLGRQLQLSEPGAASAVCFLPTCDDRPEIPPEHPASTLHCSVLGCCTEIENFSPLSMNRKELKNQVNQDLSSFGTEEKTKTTKGNFIS
ncbi:hypothetical protein J6590_052122 [Homalodisca vitripennis]|nr:hypothetical protein J6590_052122 [Homalodisca vitripennis]